MIFVKNGFFGYDKKNMILKDINIEIKKGERIAIIGPNGAGKSTLIDVMIGIKKLRKGKVEYNIGKKDIRDVVGVQFQTKEFPTGLTTKQLLDFYLKVNNLKLKDKIVQQMLKAFKLIDKLKVPLKNLSGGQQQKFNIMVAMINKPEILLLDELITGLDITSQEKIIELIEKTIAIRKSMTLVTVSHNTRELKRLTNRIIVLKKGQVVHDLSIGQIKSKYKTLEKFIGSIHE